MSPAEPARVRVAARPEAPFAGLLWYELLRAGESHPLFGFATDTGAEGTGPRVFRARVESAADLPAVVEQLRLEIEIAHLGLALAAAEPLRVSRPTLARNESRLAFGRRYLDEVLGQVCARLRLSARTSGWVVLPPAVLAECVYPQSQFVKEPGTTSWLPLAGRVGTWYVPSADVRLDLFESPFLDAPGLAGVLPAAQWVLRDLVVSLSPASGPACDIVVEVHERFTVASPRRLVRLPAWR